MTSTESNDATQAAGGTWIYTSPQPPPSVALARIDSFGVISVEGDDALSFLQGQLTNEVAKLAADKLQLNGYCSAKGRLYAVFNNWRDANAVYLQLPREILPAVMKRLSMFVLRAKVRLRDASDEWQTLAILGPDAAASLKPLGAELPKGGNTSVTQDGSLLVRLPPAPQTAERFLLLQRRSRPEGARLDLPVVEVPEGYFWWTQIDAGVPMVFAATQEKFVPQMINLEVLGAVSFKKGCYPGQEVVARSQYLGKLRRRMQIAHLEGAIAAGDDVFAADAENPVGTVVMAASAPQGGMDLLFECAAQHFESDLRARSASGPRLAVRALPYELVDVTA